MPCDRLNFKRPLFDNNEMNRKEKKWSRGVRKMGRKGGDGKTQAKLKFLDPQWRGVNDIMTC